MEAYYKRELQKAKSIMKKKDVQLKSLKDRLAPGVDISIKTGDTERMNNPVSKARLIEMYDNLRLEQWPPIKDLLKSYEKHPVFIKLWVQQAFENAGEQMRRQQQQIDETFGLTETSSGPTPQKVKEHRQLVDQNLQMALYYGNKDLLKTPFSKYKGEPDQDEMVKLRHLTTECFWLGCLMALNHPPLRPDWENLSPDNTSWDIFPTEIKASTVK